LEPVLASHSSGAHERIGRYEVLRKIATGGMAELFLAKMVGMEGFEKVVAIKRILAHLAYDEEFINMFRDEARIVAKLSHPNIVQIYDLGKSDETYFIAMEYIPGRNLSSVAKKARGLGQKLPPTYIARCLAQACEGLYYAHTRKDIDGRPLKIVHRDVSPQNIIVSFSGTVKLVDFGIAKAATKIAHTRAGVLKGKYAYMSPEQIRGEETDARSDLFAAGIVLYELLCGRRPFEKENSIQTLKSIVQDPHVDCRKLNPDIPDTLAEIIDNALTKDPNERYANAQELQVALEDFVNGSGERVNNITISKWVSDLFEEELSRERGGTVVFQGVGEVILPDFDGEEASDDDIDVEEASDAALEAPEPSEELVPLRRGRGGGSVDPRPPIPAPSNSMVQPLDDSRGVMLEEGVIERPEGDDDDEDPWDEDATVHGLDAIPGSPRDETVPRKKTPYDDDKTEFAPPHQPPPEAAEPPPRPRTDEVSLLSESVTLNPDEIRPGTLPDRPKVDTPSEVLAMDVGESLLGPLEDGGDDDAFFSDDPWDEATVGYPDGAPPVEELLGSDVPAVDSSEIVALDPNDTASASEASVGPTTGEMLADAVDSMDDVFEDDPDAWGELSDNFEGDATIAGDPAIWDDETASRDAYAATGEFSLDPQPVADHEPIVVYDDDDVDLDLMDAEPVIDRTIATGAAIRVDSTNDATIAVSKVTVEMAERAAVDFEGDATIAANRYDSDIGDGGVRVEYDDDKTREFAEGMLPESASRPDSTAWSSDATIAGGPSVDMLAALHDDDDDDLGAMPDIGAMGQEHSETVRAMDEEPELPVPFVDRGDEDGRTVAGVTSDYLSAGVDVPVGGSYDPTKQPEMPTEAPSFEAETKPPSPKPKRGQEALGAIRLNRVAADHDETQDGGEERTSTGVHPSELHAPAGEPEPSLPELGGLDFEFAIDDDDDAPPVQPSPLDDSDEPANVPSIAGEEYSALIAPEVPKPLNAPNPNAGRIGSTNVPPSNLSLSAVLSNPADARLSSPSQPAARDVSVPGRSASMLGRRIREVVRPEDAPPKATGSALHFTPQNLTPMNPATDTAPLGPPLEMQNIPAMAAPGGPSTKKRALIVGLVAVAVVLLCGVAFLAIPMILPGKPQLVLQSTPPGATVFINGERHAKKTPVTIDGLQANVPYRVRLEMEGYEAVESDTVTLPRTRPLIWNTPLKKKQ
jgi:serine/threonine protein kinase